HHHLGHRRLHLPVRRPHHHLAPPRQRDARHPHHPPLAHRLPRHRRARPPPRPRRHPRPPPRHLAHARHRGVRRPHHPGRRKIHRRPCRHLHRLDHGRHLHHPGRPYLLHQSSLPYQPFCYPPELFVATRDKGNACAILETQASCEITA